MPGCPDPRAQALNGWRRLPMPGLGRMNGRREAAMAGVRPMDWMTGRRQWQGGAVARMTGGSSGTVGRVECNDGEDPMAEADHAPGMLGC